MHEGFLNEWEGAVTRQSTNILRKVQRIWNSLDAQGRMSGNISDQLRANDPTRMSCWSSEKRV